jgi:predicted amino acid racemase
MPARKQPVQAHEPSHRSALLQPAVTKCHSKLFLHQSPADVLAVADALDALPNGRFAGITTVPALLFDPETRSMRTTPNLITLRRAAEALRRAGRADIQINAPGTSASTGLALLEAAGATQCEPGHGLTGTTPLHAIEDLPERPAVAYVSEVAHRHAGRAYCFGGGLYIDPIFPHYPLEAIVAREPTTTSDALMAVEIPPPTAIDYYGMIDGPDPTKAAIGDTVVFGFRPQIFVTRASVLHGSSTEQMLAILNFGYARRTYFRRPSSSIRFSACTAMTTSVARRRSVRDRSPSPMTRLKRLMSASTRARQ